MATNTFILPSVVASRGIATLYNSLVFAELIWRDFDPEFRGKQGDTVTVRKPAVFTAVQFDQTARTTTYQDATEDSVDITLDTLLHVPFHVTDEQQTLEISDFQAQLLNPAMEALAQKIDGTIAEALVDAAEGAGGGGTVNKSDDPATTDGPDYPFRKAREKLTRANSPASDRHGVLSPESTTDALGSELLVAVDKSGSTDALRNAIIGRLFGIETYESNALGRGPGDAGQADGVAFHRSALVFAVRPLNAPRGVDSSRVATQNYKSLALRVLYSYDEDAKMDKVVVDILTGKKATRPELAVQLNYGIGS